MIKRFTSEQLRQVRNDVPIEALIRALGVAGVHSGEGRRFRFQCPQCLCFQTATNERTNLARCFGCSRNFNTIEITMLVNERPFVDCVKFLQEFKSKSLEHKTLCSAPSSGLTSIGEMLRRIALAGVRR